MSLPLSMFFVVGTVVCVCIRTLSLENRPLPGGGAAEGAEDSEVAVGSGGHVVDTVVATVVIVVGVVTLHPIDLS